MSDTLEGILMRKNEENEQNGKEWTVLVTGYGVSQLLALSSFVHSNTLFLYFFATHFEFKATWSNILSLRGIKIYLSLHLWNSHHGCTGFASISL